MPAEPRQNEAAAPTEAWMRGILPGMDPVTGHLLRAAEQIREDARSAIADLTARELWSARNTTPAAFHARHLAGSTDRLCTYLEGRQLSPEQLASLAAEKLPGAESAPELLTAIDAALDRYETLVRNLPPDQFGAVREVGRKRFPVSAVGLAIHIAEHAQRHIGGMIAAAKLARNGAG